MSAWQKAGAWIDLRIIWVLRRLNRHPTDVQSQAWDDLENLNRAILGGHS